MSEERLLRIADRCDRCGAQAFVLATVNGTDLLFCGHHFNRWEDDIREVASRVVDERKYINSKPSPSATITSPVKGEDHIERGTE